MTRKNISAFAASAAFFLFLSMVPLLMALCAILPYTSLTADNLIMAFMKIVPESMGGFVESVVYDVYARTAGTITIFAIVTIWSAAKAMLALVQGLNEVNDIEEKRNYFVLHLTVREKTFQYFLIVISQTAHLFRTVLRHAYAVAVAAASQCISYHIFFFFSSFNHKKGATPIRSLRKCRRGIRRMLP